MPLPSIAGKTSNSVESPYAIIVSLQTILGTGLQSIAMQTHFLFNLTEVGAIATFRPV
jgi:hypothetical protein